MLISAVDQIAQVDVRPLGVEFSSRPLARVLVFEVDAPQAPVLISAVGQIAQVDVRPLGRRIFLSALGQSTCF